MTSAGGWVYDRHRPMRERGLNYRTHLRPNEHSRPIRDNDIPGSRIGRIFPFGSRLTHADDSER